MTNSVDPKQTAPIGPPCLLLYLDLSVMFGNYLQQTTSADVIFQMHFFLGALRVNLNTHIQKNVVLMWSYISGTLNVT